MFLNPKLPLITFLTLAFDADACFWNEFEEQKCYKRFDDEVDYETAVANCMDAGAWIAEPRSDAEMDFITEVYGNSENAWIGITDLLEEGA